MVKNVHFSKFFLVKASLLLALCPLSKARCEESPLANTIHGTTKEGKGSGAGRQFVNLGRVDLQLVFKNSEDVKKTEERLKHSLESLQKKYEKIVKDAEEQSKKIQVLKASGVAEKTIRDKLAKLAQATNKELEKLKRDQVAIRNTHYQKMVEIQRLLGLITTSVAEKHGCDIIFNSEVLMYFNPAKCSDYTEEVLSRLNSIQGSHGKKSDDKVAQKNTESKQ
jgi:Skp family chaperone for outer membrane proteins